MRPFCDEIHRQDGDPAEISPQKPVGRIEHASAPYPMRCLVFAL